MKLPLLKIIQTTTVKLIESPGIVVGNVTVCISAMRSDVMLHDQKRADTLAEKQEQEDVTGEVSKDEEELHARLPVCNALEGEEKGAWR